MKLTLRPAGLRERKSDERDAFTLANATRDSVNSSGHYVASKTTPDATPLEVWRDTVNADSTLILNVAVAASSAIDYAAYNRRVIVTRTGATAAVIQATDTFFADFETDATWDIGFSVSGGDIILTVTGAAGKTISWRADVFAVWSPFE